MTTDIRYRSEVGPVATDWTINGEITEMERAEEDRPPRKKDKGKSRKRRQKVKEPVRPKGYDRLRVSVNTTRSSISRDTPVGDVRTITVKPE
jgi:hypothetical protein